ncbi:MAG TPA: hypothetical protein VM941_08235 [Pyrinomonadaceae bacterium]|jgi:DUF4097 and DUF4098 domain-containing protein YvlB|nr:hypothetical protein [Pyrinomonadaceae bacterium]
MKRIVILILLVVLAGIAGVVVRSSSGSGTVAEIRGLVSQNASGDVRDEIRQTYELAPGARVEVGGINGPVNIETADTRTAEVYIERTASSEEALSRRKITVEGSGDKLRIRGETIEHKFLAKLFGSKASEKVTLKLPRQISLLAKGVNGAVIVGEISGPIEISGINGKVQVANAAGSATLKGINGSVMVGLKSVVSSGIEMSGINGNIELQLPANLNADFEARGMNGRVIADYPNASIDKSRHGNYSGRIGSGGAQISASGINGNIRLTPSSTSARSSAPTGN